MFDYFGRKARIAHLYPRPIYDTIIEPFAGSAAYAGHGENWRRQVILVEIDPAIAELWRWLIDSSTSFDTIMGLPTLNKGDPIPDIGPGRVLYGLVSPSADNNKRVMSEWMARDWPKMQYRVALGLDRVKHWQVIEGDYTQAPDVKASWFVDPPYQQIEHGYGKTRDTLDFKHLGEWCRERQGQVIACDELGADWLPFVPLTRRNTINNTTTTEAVWLSQPDVGRLFVC